MGVPFRYILGALTILAPSAAGASDATLGFSGVVPGAPIWPAKAVIASFADTAAIDVTVSNPRAEPAVLQLHASPGVSVSRKMVALKAHGVTQVRAFIDLGDDAARPATVCAVINDGASRMQACGEYIARRFNID